MARRIPSLPPVVRGLRPKSMLYCHLLAPISFSPVRLCPRAFRDRTQKHYQSVLFLLSGTEFLYKVLKENITDYQNRKVADEFNGKSHLDARS